jgi:hypothetical protein
MNSYAYIEQLFKAILQQSLQIQGRLYLLARKGNELNTDELERVLTEHGPEVKYPCAVMLAPRSSGVFSANNEWEEYQFTLMFLNTTYYTGSGQIASLIDATQTSGRPVAAEWEAMKQSAVDFIKVLRLVQRGNNGESSILVNSVFRLGNAEKIYIDPVSFIGTHRLSGVRVSFKASLYTSCGIADYTSGGLVVLPPVDDSTFAA